jgi:polyisoprenoid-binding protein YceI
MTTWFKRNWQVSFFGVLILALLIISFTQKTESQDAAKAYQIDAVHSSVLFRAKHLGVTYFYGRFNEFSGNITMDEADVSKSKVEFEVKTASVDTANAKRDQHLRSPDFFNAKQFPVLTFKSTKVSEKAGQENILEVTGDFELHGVKKSITVDVEITGKGKSPQGGELIGFETTFAIKRSEFGMTYGMQGVSDDIRITVSIEAGKK